MPTPRPKKGAPEIDLAEMQNSHAFKGMLSFLDESAEEKRQRVAGSIDHSATDQTRVDQTLVDQTPVDQHSTKMRLDPNNRDRKESRKPPPLEDELTLGSSPINHSKVQALPGVDQSPTVLTPLDLVGIDRRSIDHSGTDQDDRHANLEDAPALLLHGKAKPKAARTVQDGHSSGEDKIYDILWKYSRPHTPEARLLSIGYSALAELSRMAPTNCRANVFSLIEKKAIDEYKMHTKAQATTYLIYNYGTILQRRKEAGLTHVIRTRGVVFVDPETCAPLTRQMGEFRLKGRTLLNKRSLAIPSIDQRSIDHLPTTDLLRAKGSVRERSEGSIHQRSSPPYRLKSFSSTDDDSLRAILQAKLPAFDDYAVDTLWRDCRQQVPDVAAEEIASLFAIKLPGSKGRGIENQNGFLIAAVARSCTPAAISALRQGREVPKEAPSINIPADELAAMLDDPKTPEWMLELIRAKMTVE